MPSSYSARLELGLGFAAAHAALDVESWPIRWFGWGAHVAWLGHLGLDDRGTAYGAGATLGVRTPIRLGYLFFNVVGGAGRYRRTVHLWCPSLVANQGQCLTPETRHDVAAFLGASVASLFKVGATQMGPLVRMDHLGEVYVLTINLVVGVPHS